MHIERITHDPAIVGGKPCIRDLRVTVGTILGLLVLQVRGYSHLLGRSFRPRGLTCPSLAVKI